MWTCPECKARFVNKNQSHSCVQSTVAKFLIGKSGAAVHLFEHFLSEYRKIGPFDLHPVKTRVALLTKMRFCAVNKIGTDFIDLHLVLTKAYPKASCFRRIESIGDRFFIHHLRILSKRDIDSEVRKFMKFAYDTGNRKHIEHPKK